MAQQRLQLKTFALIIQHCAHLEPFEINNLNKYNIFCILSMSFAIKSGRIFCVSRYTNDKEKLLLQLDQENGDKLQVAVKGDIKDASKWLFQSSVTLKIETCKLC